MKYFLFCVLGLFFLAGEFCSCFLVQMGGSAVNDSFAWKEKNRKNSRI